MQSWTNQKLVHLSEGQKYRGEHCELFNSVWNRWENGRNKRNFGHSWEKTVKIARGPQLKPGITRTEGIRKKLEEIGKVNLMMPNSNTSCEALSIYRGAKTRELKREHWNATFSSKRSQILKLFESLAFDQARMKEEIYTDATTSQSRPMSCIRFAHFAISSQPRVGTD
jgi:hypothetical protein